MEGYKIGVYMTPSYHDNKYKPHFWILFKWCGDDWCNDGCGWAETPEKAWEEAYDFYTKFKINKMED